jgi:cephalosporin hydroxylase
VLELGIWHGGTLYHWLTEARRDAPVTVVAVDPEIIDERLFRSWAPDNVTLHLIEGRSSDPQTVHAVKEISSRYDWIFVDADHHYQAVEADWAAYRPLVVTGAVVFHDVTSSVNPDQEVPLFWADLKKAGWKTDEFSSPEGREAGWGGIGVVFPGC